MMWYLLLCVCVNVFGFVFFLLLFFSEVLKFGNKFLVVFVFKRWKSSFWTLSEKGRQYTAAKQ